MPSSEVLRLPDLIGLCPFPVSSNPHCAQAGVESAAWIERYNVFSERNRSFFLQLCGERLVSRAYPYADFESARTCCDFMNLVFVLDEISDDQDGAGARETGDTFLKAMSDEPCDGSLLSRITKESVAKSLLTYRTYITTFLTASKSVLPAKRGLIASDGSFNTVQATYRLCHLRRTSGNVAKFSTWKHTQPSAEKTAALGPLSRSSNIR